MLGDMETLGKVFLIDDPISGMVFVRVPFLTLCGEPHVHSRSAESNE